MSKVKLVLNILWTVPITCFVIFLVLLFVPGTWPFPESVNLGKASSIKFQVNSSKNLFYIARDFSIQEDYSQFLTKLKFNVIDSSGKEIGVDTVDHFFYGGKVDGKYLDAGSVFCLPPDVKYPFNGQLKSNISELDGLVWVKTEGSFALATFVFLGVIAISIYINYSIYIRCRKNKMVNPN